MFSNFLIKKFISDSQNVSDVKVRNSYANLACIIGIIINSILFLIKLSIGIISGSVSILADAFNNLSDTATSIMTIVGFKLASKPADAKHPFGYGRIEYINAGILSFMVMYVGIMFLVTSLTRIINPIKVTFELMPFILLLISIGFKFWLSKFNKSIGNKINSFTLKATAADAMGDVFTSTTVVISFLLCNFTTLPIDGYIGFVVALFIIYSGFSLAKKTANPLIGETPDPNLVRSIKDTVMSYDNIIGVHDLIIHNYGHRKIMASIHAEIPSNIDIMEIHDIIDKAEREVAKKLNIFLVIHMDPVCAQTDEMIEARKIVSNVLNKYKEIKSFHDFRIIKECDKKKLLFDIEVYPEYLSSANVLDELVSLIECDIKEKAPEYQCIIAIDLAL